MDAELLALAERQLGLLSWRQLRSAGWSATRITRAAGRRELLRVHDGVFAVGHRPTDPAARWWAAILTHPGSVLSAASAGALLGLRPWHGRFEVVTRPGSGGPVRYGDVLVCRSTTLIGDTTVVRGLPTTTGARTLLDLAPHLDPRQLDRSTREALRLGATSGAELRATLDRHRRRRGVSALRDLTERYADLPLADANSDAEALAFVQLVEAGRPVPYVDRWYEGEEADLSWPHLRRIVEIDGPDFHRFAAEDARKQAKWEAAGWDVRRLRSDEVYAGPAAILGVAPD